MKQIFQNLKTGAITAFDTPAPAPGPRDLLIRTRASLVSAGTERMLRDFARAGFIDKARQQPDRVRQVLDKMRTDGVLTTLDAVFAKLDQPLPLGYCNVGEVVATGSAVKGFSVGDRVLSNGQHAEIVCVPQTLCAKVPEGVSDGAASFGVVAAIGLQGIRLIAPTLGETIVVYGLGLIGLLSVQMLLANGCKVIGIDRNSERVALAESYGASAFVATSEDDPVRLALAANGGAPVDGVLITASAKTNDIISASAQMCRKRGRIVLTGVIGLTLDRSLFYDKEISFQVSCSYGPGRYDPAYEQGGQDYPIGFVRWTEQRNFEAVLGLMAAGRVDAEPLISYRAAFDKHEEAYRKLDDASVIGIVLDYPGETPTESLKARSVTRINAPATPVDAPQIAVIGTGNFAQSVLLPALVKAGAHIGVVAGRQGASAAIAGERFAIDTRTTDTDSLIANGATNAVVITTRHDSHADLVIRALEAGKAAFVEKPLALSATELDRVIAAHEGAAHPRLLVGFNRRFAPMSVDLHKALSRRSGPAFISILCNAGFIPPEHWVHDLKAGGGRILGEACHFIDLYRFLTASPIIEVSARFTGTEAPTGTEDTAAITLKSADGSLGQIAYVATGSKKFPKERVTALFDGKTAEINNFTRLTGYGVGLSRRALRQDKGHNAEAHLFVQALKTGGPSPIPFDELVNVTCATLAAVESATTGLAVAL